MDILLPFFICFGTALVKNYFYFIFHYILDTFVCSLGNILNNIPCANHQKQWIFHWYSHTFIAHMAWLFKVFKVSCYCWEVMRGKMLQRYTVVHGEILEPVHYMHYIFFLQAHLNRIYQVWNLRGTEMYWRSVAKYASRFDEPPTEII